MGPAARVMVRNESAVGSNEAETRESTLIEVAQYATKTTAGVVGGGLSGEYHKAIDTRSLYHTPMAVAEEENPRRKA